MLILKKSCKALITALCTLFIYSCSSNNELDINSYQLQSIQWKLSADDAEKVDTIELPPKTTSNNTEEPMSITFSFEENIKKHNKIQDKTPERSDCKTVCPYFFSFKRVEKTFSTGILPKYRMFQEHYGHNPLICLVFSAM